MEKRTKNGISWLEFPLLAPFIHHGIFLRTGGVSLPPFDSLNTCSRVGDDEAHVSTNVTRARATLALPPICLATQVHGDAIAYIKSPLKELTADGLISKEPGACMGIHHADCQAAIFYDPHENCLATIHCGWRGSCLNIYQTCVTLMQKEHGCNPSNILVGISPSLGPKHAEFIDLENELPAHFAPFIENNLVNFWDISRMQLLQAGILPEHIEVAEVCTYGSPNDYFSYRRDRQTGRNLTVAYLKPS